MKIRLRVIALLAATGAVAASLTGCGGDDPAAAPEASTTPADLPTPDITISDDPTPLTKGRPLPTVKPAQVRGIVGKWVSGGPVQDYFVFKTDGSGTWTAKGRALWTGRVIPAGGGLYRLSWDGKDTDASYWAVKLDQSGDKLLFEGNQQTYTRAGTSTTGTGTTGTGTTGTGTTGTGTTG